MTDPRYPKLASLLINYSTALKQGERILLDMIDVPDEFTIELIRAVRAAGATPFVETRHTRVGRELLLGTNRRARERQHERKLRRAERADESLHQNRPAPAGLSREQDALVRPALAVAQHGASGRHEHGGLREIVF
jgi:leucyl aminopeptidase (aminopeptidase T)